MKPEIANKWADALESGQYKQGKYLLRNSTNNYCCLGVLCDLAVKEGIIPEPVHENHFYSYDGEEGALPVSVRNWAGIKSYKCQYSEKETLVALNDRGKPFKEIAQIIRKNIDKL